MQNNKQIVFLESYSTVMSYKIAKLFKKHGYKTTLIRLLEPSKLDEEFYNDAYTNVINLNFNFDFKSNFFSLDKKLKILVDIMKLNPYIIIGKANPNRPVAIFRVLFRKTPFIYFPYDVRSQYCPKIARLAMKERGLSRFEIKSERFNFEHADGVMHKGPEDELKYLNGRMLGDNIKLPEHQIAFHPYCSRDFIISLNKNKLSKKDKETHVVYLTTGGEIKKADYKPFFNTAKKIMNQKIHFHLYIGNLLKINDNPAKEFMEEHKNYPGIEYFHIHAPLDPRKIVKEISRYDFGLWDIFYAGIGSGIGVKMASGNKFATFLEAGVPFFYSSELTFVNELAEKYNIALPLTDEGFNSLDNLKNRIKKLDYRKLERNILKARKDFDMEKHFSRLEEFVKKVIASKKNIF